MKLGNILNANTYQIKDFVVDNKTTRPGTPLEGQTIYNTVSQRIEYWSGTPSGWITLNPAGVQTITLSGDISGTGSSTISTTAGTPIITSKPISTDLAAESAFLFYDVNIDELVQLRWETVESWVLEQINQNTYDLTTSLVTSGVSINLVGVSSTDSVSVIGTTNEIEVASIAGGLQIGLPNSITVTSINVTNLTINGVPYAPYVHPTQSAITVDGSGLQFVQDVNVNTLGHTTSVSLGTIPSATESVTGVSRLATDIEITNGTPGVVVQASQLELAISNREYVTSIAGSAIVTHNLSTLDVSVECYDESNGETIYPNVMRTSINQVTIEFGSSFPVSTRVLIKGFKI